jgi:uncharacterized protein (DUF1919 family)
MEENVFECQVYIFGECRSICIITNHSLTEIQNDWELREKLITEKILNSMEIQSYIKQL